MKTHKLIFVLFALTAIWSCSKNPDVIAKIDGTNYTKADLYQVYNPAYFDALDKNKQKEKLNEWAEKHLAFSELQNIQDNDKQNYYSKVSGWEDKALLNALFENAIIEKIAGAGTLKQIHKNMSTDKKVRHLLISRENPEKISLLSMLKRDLNLENFASFAEKYSDDKGSGSRGGDLGFVKTGQMVAAFDSAMYATPLNVLSKPFTSEYGTHFIIIDEEKKRDTLSFKDAKPQLLSIVSNFYKVEIRSYAAFFIDSLKEKNSLYIYSKNCELISDSLRSLRRKNPGNTNNESIIDLLNSFDGPLPIAVVNDSTSFYQDWLIYFLRLQNGPNLAFSSPNQIEKFISNNFQNYLLIKEAKIRHLDEDSVLQREKPRYAYEAAFNFYKEYLIKNIKPSEKELQSWYDENKDRLYSNAQKVQVQEILVSDSLLAESLLSQIQSGESMDSLASLYTERNYSKKKNGLLPFFKKGRYGSMGKRAFEMNIGDLDGPFSISDSWSIIKLLDIEEKTYKKYSDVEEKVKKTVVNKKQKEEIKKTFSKLMKKYHVRLYENAL